jgi:hypothetical protein
MIIKKRAILNKIRFQRYKSSEAMYPSVCSSCVVGDIISDNISDFCNLCETIFFATHKALGDRMYYSKFTYLYKPDVNQEIKDIL